jgi:hypothetical protein
MCRKYQKCAVIRNVPHYDSQDYHDLKHLGQMLKTLSTVAARVNIISEVNNAEFED